MKNIKSKIKNTEQDSAKCFNKKTGVLSKKESRSSFTNGIMWIATNTVDWLIISRFVSNDKYFMRTIKLQLKIIKDVCFLAENSHAVKNNLELPFLQKSCWSSLCIQRFKILSSRYFRPCEICSPSFSKHEFSITKW